MGGVQYSSRPGRAPAKTPNQIRRYRVQLALTQREVARYLAVRPSTVSSWERGKTCPAVPLLFKLAKFLNILSEAFYPQLYFVEPDEDTSEPDAHDSERRAA